MAPPTLSLRLHIDPASEPIRGSLVYPDGRRQTFSGWIELTAALEDARRVEGLDVVAHGKESSAGTSQWPPSSEGEGGGRRTLTDFEK